MRSLRKLHGKLIGIVLDVRQVDIDISLQRPERFHTLVAAGVVHHRDSQPWLCDVQCAYYLRNERRGTYKVDVIRAALLELKEYFSEPLYSYVLPESARADIVVLTEHAPHHAAGKKHSSAAGLPGIVRVAAYARLLPLVERSPCKPGSLPHAAETPESAAVNAAFPWAESANHYITSEKSGEQNSPDIIFN